MCSEVQSAPRRRRGPRRDDVDQDSSTRKCEKEGFVWDTVNMAIPVKWIALAFAFVVMSTGKHAAAEEILYGSRAGMAVTVTEKSGIGTAKAVIKVKHLPQNAKAFCVEYELDNSMECVRRTMNAVKTRGKVTANCVKRAWIDVHGNKYSFHGVNFTSELGLEYIIKEDNTGNVLDGSMASGYFLELDTFQALCPGIAK